MHTSTTPPSVTSRRGRLVAVSVLAGFLLTVVWSAPFVDRVIGDSVANGLLGYEARSAELATGLGGIVFAFVTGLAGSFTACNIACFSAVAPLVDEQAERGGGIRRALALLGWVTLGAAAVSALYGVVVAIFGTRMPQFSTAANVAGTLSPRSIQSMVAFGLIGLTLIYLGLAAVRLVPDPLAGITRRFPPAPLVVMGALIGAFLIGRPYGLFRVLFRDVAESHNVVYSVAAFVLQSVGNIVVMAALFALIALVAGKRLTGWIAAKPERMTSVSAAALLISGTFTLLYWDLRVLGRAGILWYPTVPW